MLRLIVRHGQQLADAPSADAIMRVYRFRWCMTPWLACCMQEHAELLASRAGGLDQPHTPHAQSQLL